MSVVVRMEMPKCCWNCPCVNGEYGYCQADKDERQIEDPNERPSWCPILCQLPEGHGRIIDADEFIEHLFTEWTNGEISNSEWCDVRQWMNEETTIVPAEAGIPSPKPTAPVPIRDVYYVMTECDVKTGTVKYEPRERIEL